MNTNLNSYPIAQDEKPITSKDDPDTAEVKEFDGEEAYRQIEIIQLIRNINKIGNNPVYCLHSKKKYTYVITNKNIHDSFKRIDPRYCEDETCTSPEVDLWRKVLKEILPQHILTDRLTDFWTRNQSDLITIAPQQSVFKAEIINELCLQLAHAIANDKNYKKAIELRKERSLNQKKKAKRLILKLLNKFSKLLVLRIDFSIHRDFKITLELLKTYLRIFIKKLHAPNDKVPPIVGFIWKLEYGLRKGYHYHFIFFMDGNTYKQDTFFADQLGKLWKSITQNKGTYHSCNHDKESYVKLAIGMLTHNDEEKIEALFGVVNYITKTEQFIIEKTQVNQRTFGYSTRKYEKNNAGRPRTISLDPVAA